MSFKAKLLAVIALAVQANAATHRIDVGMNGFTFTPDSVTAAKGDQLEFHYHPLNHSVVMGDFNNACAPASSGGFFSGFMPTSSGENANSFTVIVNDTDPIVFYCSQNTLSHCKSGMSGVVNPANSSQLTDYKNAAKNVDNAGSPASVFGGTINTASTTTGSSASSSPTSSGGGGSGNPYGGGSSGGNTNGNSAAGLTASLATLMGAAAIALFMV